MKSLEAHHRSCDPLDEAMILLDDVVQVFDRYCCKFLRAFALGSNLRQTVTTNKQQDVSVTVNFKGAHYPKSVILHAVFFYVRYAVSYRDLEEILAERGVAVDHTTLNRWVVKYSPEIATNAQRQKRKLVGTWRVDETQSN